LAANPVSASRVYRWISPSWAEQQRRILEELQHLRSDMILRLDALAPSFVRLSEKLSNREEEAQ
jgi:hypothetical protein